MMIDPQLYPINHFNIHPISVDFSYLRPLIAADEEQGTALAGI